MKKVLLSSVVALSVFAASPVFANNTGQHNSADDNADYAKAGLNNDDDASTKAKFKAAGEELKPVPGKPGEFVVSGKAKDAAKPAGKDAAKPGAAKSSAAAGQKALPKTHAAK